MNNDLFNPNVTERYQLDFTWQSLRTSATDLFLTSSCHIHIHFTQQISVSHAIVTVFGAATFLFTF